MPPGNSKTYIRRVNTSLAALLCLSMLAGCNFSGIGQDNPTPIATAPTPTAPAPRPTEAVRPPRPAVTPTDEVRALPPTSTVERPPTRKPASTPTNKPASTPTVKPVESAMRFGAYIVEWGVYDRDYVPADVPVDLLTQLYYAFISPVDVNNDGLYECAVYDSQASLDEPLKRLVPGTDKDKGENLGMITQLAVLKRAHPDLQVIMSVGGAGDSDNFPRIASNEQQRRHFAQSCVDFMDSAGFGGIDIDWEFPAVADRADFTDLLTTLREELDKESLATGQDYPLTIAASPFDFDLDAIDIAGIAPILSWVNLMTYEYYGGWADYTGHNAPLCPAVGDPYGDLWNSAGGVQLWLDGGMPPEKLNLGLPYYGQGFQHLQDPGPNHDVPGRFAAVTSGDYVDGTWDLIDGTSPGSSFDYWDIVENYSGPFANTTKPKKGLHGYTRYWDDEQGLPYVTSPGALNGSNDDLWLSYDDPQSLTRKVQYARSVKLGGVFAWELSQERAPGSNDHPLSEAIAAAIQAPLDPVSCQPAR